MIQYKKAKINCVNHNPIDKTREGYPIYKHSFHMANGLSVYITIVGKNEMFKKNQLTQIGHDLWFYLSDRIGLLCHLWRLSV